jgi:molybdate transport system substrate-binding protein
MRRILQFGFCVLANVCINGCRAPQHPTLIISVAASLQESITEIEAAYEQEQGGVDFRNNFGASGTLAREIEQGAPVDAFIAAGAKPMDELQTKDLLLPGTRKDLLRNALVLIAPQDSTLKGFDGLIANPVKLIALGDPASVPAGMYGKQTLQSLHLYDQLASKIVLGKDVRQVLTYVETGNADAGLVYATDAQSSTKVRTVAVATESSHDAIVYPIAEVKTSKNGAAVRAFLAFLTSPAARDIFAKHGFTMA